MHLICDGVELKGVPKKIFLFNKKESFVDLPWEVPFTGSEKRIASYHNFEETPQDLQLLFEQMSQQKAYVYKIATMARCALDSLRMLAFVRRMFLRGHRIIGLCMGEEGILTRILSPIVGNLWSYTYLHTPTAAGQLSIKSLTHLRFRSFTRNTGIYGLIGNPLSQSPSFQTHNAFFREKKLDAVYVHVRLEANQLAEGLSLMKEIGFRGLSVTIPYKEKISPFLQSVEPAAKEIGAINTIRFTEEGLHGYNTDAKAGIDALNQVLQGKRIVCLGAGGAAKALAYEARLRGAEVLLLTRSGLASGVPKEYDILINATPSPCPIDPHTIIPGTVVMEINSHFSKTPFLQVAKERGCKIILGMDMFYRQAIEQFIHWELLEVGCRQNSSFSF